MTAQLLLQGGLVAVAGGVGAVLRFVLDSFVQSRVGGRFPLGIVIVNVTGSLALGVLTALVTVVGQGVLVVVGVGLLGGYTTFSTAMVDAVRLLLDRRVTAFVGYTFGTVVLSVGFAFGGFAATASLVG